MAIDSGWGAASAGAPHDAEGSGVCALAWSVARGNGAGVPGLVRELLPAVTAYSRARARTRGFSFDEADRFAVESCRDIIGALTSPRGTHELFVRTAYRVVSEGADARFGRVGSARSCLRHDILILRTIVGLDAEETATAMGISPGRVRTEQHVALRGLCAA